MFYVDVGWVFYDCFVGGCGGGFYFYLCGFGLCVVVGCGECECCYVGELDGKFFYCWIFLECFVVDMCGVWFMCCGCGFGVVF